MSGIRIVDSNKEMDENHWSVIMKNEYTERLADKTIEELVDNFNSDFVHHLDMGFWKEPLCK